MQASYERYRVRTHEYPDPIGGHHGHDDTRLATTSTQSMKEHSKRTRGRQGDSDKPLYHLNLPHPKLMCRIEPDVRPFEWPRRPRRTRNKDEPLAVELFDLDLIKFFRDLDDVEDTHGQD